MHNNTLCGFCNRQYLFILSVQFFAYCIEVFALQRPGILVQMALKLLQPWVLLPDKFVVSDCQRIPSPAMTRHEFAWLRR